jgi:2-polyprenyl-3-methyl-5-hydroxy-6-metoxy-1,4-benzoquinol methylase
MDSGTANLEACRICGTALDSSAAMPARDYATGDAFRVVHCATCDTRSTRPVPASLDAYYGAAYRRYDGLAGRILCALVRRRARGWLRGRPTGTVIEIGAGNGYMLGEFRRCGWHAYGTERDTATAKLAASESGATVIVGEVDALDPAVRAELVVIFHVLEHVASPVSTLRAAAARLATGGEVIVSVPNAASWQARIFGASWFHLDVPRHLHHFSPAAMAAAMRAAGLEIRGMSFVSVEHDPFGWVQSTLNAVGFQPNALATSLTARARPGGGELPARAIALIIALPALVLAAVSWVAGAGAVMTVRASRPGRAT